jgi:hypothetical protein
MDVVSVESQSNMQVSVAEAEGLAKLGNPLALNDYKEGSVPTSHCLA